MRFTTVAVFLFAAVGVVANPVDLEADLGAIVEIEARDALITFEGKCSDNKCIRVWTTTTGSGKKKTNKYKDAVKCASNSKCKDDGNKCTYKDRTKTATCS